LSRSQNALAEKREQFDVLNRAKQQAEHAGGRDAGGVPVGQAAAGLGRAAAAADADAAEQFEADREAAADRLAEAEATLERGGRLAELTADWQDAKARSRSTRRPTATGSSG
jgi:hypothetical protein